MGTKSITKLWGYISICILTFPGYILLNTYRNSITQNVVLSFLNQYLIERYGIIISSVVFWLSSLEWNDPEKTLSSSNLRILQASVRFLIFLLFYIFINVWLFGPSIYSRINVLTGGHCENLSGAKLGLTYSQCISKTYKWINGFDISGHVYYTVTSSMLAYIELDTHSDNSSLLPLSHSQFVEPNIAETHVHSEIEDDLNHSNSIPSLLFFKLQCKAKNWELKLHRYYILLKILVRSFIYLMLIFWLVMYIITNLFFHTFFERLLSFIFVIPCYYCMAYVHV